MKTDALHATGTELPVYKEHIDLTAHQFAEAVEDAWHYTPLQTKDGFGRVFGDLWVVGDWLFSDVYLPPALFQTERRAASALFFISKSEGRRGFVQAACERWGFSSPANFNRTIQRLFGNSPKALLFSRDRAEQNTYETNSFITDFLAIRHDGGTGALEAVAA